MVCMIQASLIDSFPVLETGNHDQGGIKDWDAKKEDGNKPGGGLRKTTRVVGDCQGSEHKTKRLRARIAKKCVGGQGVEVEQSNRTPQENGAQKRKGPLMRVNGNQHKKSRGNRNKTDCQSIHAIHQV